MNNLLKYLSFFSPCFTINLACKKENISPDYVDARHLLRTNGGIFSHKPNGGSHGKAHVQSEVKTKV